ncbi:MAG: TetR/AcrR family transcriptional regulator [Ignavibacteriota bacterium]
MPRTLSESAHQKAIRATLKLVAKHGVDATSMDAIATEAGVSKATIYKHWGDKEKLLLEVMATVAGLHPRPTFDSGDTRADMVAVLAYHPKQNRVMRERLLPQFVAYSARNMEFGTAWRSMAMEPPRRELTRLIAQGVDRGELLPDLDMDVCLALLLGPVLYWYIFLKKTIEDPRTLAQGVVDVFWRAFGKNR